MERPRVLVDTNLVIDLFRDLPPTKAALRKYPDRAISIVTWMEVMAGLKAAEQSLLDDFAQDFPVVPFDQDMAEECVNIRRTTKLKLPDAMILATAHVEQRVLLTRNTRDFKPGRFVVVPYTV